MTQFSLLKPPCPKTVCIAGLNEGVEGQRWPLGDAFLPSGIPRQAHSFTGDIYPEQPSALQSGRAHLVMTVMHGADLDGLACIGCF